MRSVLVTPAKAGAQSVAPAKAGAQSVTPAKAGAQSVAPAKAGAQFAFLAALCLAPCTSFASALDDFLAFNTATKTATAHFEQQVIDRSGKVTDRASGEFAFRVGLPGKSGVGGGILAVAPRRGAAAVWSPGLNAAGTSQVGALALERFAAMAGWSVF